MNTFLNGPNITGPAITLDSVYNKIFALIGLGAGFIYITFAILFFFRIKSLHNGLKTEAGKFIVMLALANIVVAVIISVFGFLLAMV